MITSLSSRFLGPLTIGLFAGATDVGTRVAGQLIENNWVGLPTAVTVALSVGAFVWWIDGRFEQRLQQDKAVGERLSKIEQRLDDLTESDHFRRKRR